MICALAFFLVQSYCKRLNLDKERANMKKNLSIVLLVMIVAGLSFFVGRFSQPSQLEVY